MSVQPRQYYQLPPVVTHPIDGVWSVIVPIARTNLVTNPSFETATTSWTAIGGSIARSTTYQYHGAYSLAVTPGSGTTDGVRYDTVSLTSGTTYAYSAKVRGQAGLKYKLCVETTGASELASVHFIANGRWQWVWGIWKETSTTTRRITLRKDSQSNTTVVYLDGVQVEACETNNYWSTTYIDGDQQGFVPSQSPPAYWWNGTPHASTSSRSGQTRAGGRVVPFRKYGFILSAIVGLGLAVPNNVLTPYAQIDGAYFQRTQKPPREFSIAGRFSAGTGNRLMQQRGGLASLFDRDVTGLDQPLALLYEPTDPCAQPSGHTVYLPALYAGGLDGQMDNHHAEQASMAFTAVQPTLTAQQEEGASLTVQASVASNNRIIQRSPAGVWDNLGTGLNNSVTAMVVGKDNKLYVAGFFTTAGGGAANYVAVWDPAAQTWSATAGGPGNFVYGLAVAPNGDIIAASVLSVQRWNGSAWSAIGTFPGTTPLVQDVAVDATGNIYGVGYDTTGTTALAAKWDGSSWTTLASGDAGILYTAAIGPDNLLYVGGEPTTLGAVTVNRIAKYTGSAWVALSTGMNNPVYSVTFGPDGTLYAIGTFTTAGGATAQRAAKWNGVSWVQMGDGLAASTIMPESEVRVAPVTNQVYVTDSTKVYRFTGGTFVQADVDFGATATTGKSLAFADDNTLYIGHDRTGTRTVGATATVTNSGTARTYPTLIMKGPTSGTSRIYQIVNETTGRAVYFDYTINAGETATLCFDPERLSFTSDFFGNIATTILPGSTEADFFLQPGANVISFFSADSTVTATMYWHPALASLDDATYQRQ